MPDVVSIKIHYVLFINTLRILQLFMLHDRVYGGVTYFRTQAQEIV